MAKVSYSRFRGKTVSLEWATVLRAVEQQVRFQLNDGHRTMADQRQRVRDHGLFGPGNPTGAAYPSPTAPHIREGRIDHALDVDMYVGDGVQALARELRSMGVRVSFPISTEGWHIEAPAGDLRTAAFRLNSLAKHRRRLAGRRAKRDRSRGVKRAYYDRLCRLSLKSIRLRKRQLHQL